MWYPLVATVILLTGNGVLGMTDMTELLSILTQEIILRYFMDIPKSNKCLGIITEDNTEILDYLLPLEISIYHVHLTHQEFMYSKRMETEFEEYPWEDRIFRSINVPCLGYVIQTSNIKWMVKSFARMYHNEKALQRFNRTFLYLPVVSRLMSDAEFEDHISEVFRMREMDLMPDLDIVKLTKEMYVEHHFVNTFKSGNSNTALDDINIEIITQRYVSLTPYERVLLDVWNPKHGFLRGANLFPYKMSNLMGKTVTSVSTNYPPLVVLDYSKDPVVFDGLEPQFVLEWGRRLNFTPAVAYNDDFWGVIFKNGSGNGLLGMISADKADIAFDAFYPWEPEFHFLDYSTPHAWSRIILICPKPKLLSGWMVPTLPFSCDMWMSVVISVAICATLLYVTSLASVRFLGNEIEGKITTIYSTWIECAFRTSGLLVLQVPPDERDWSTPRYVPMRHLVTWLILFYFVVTTAYCGGLATVLTVPSYENPIETPEDMADRNIKWTGVYEGYLLNLRNTTNPALAQVEKNFELDADGEELIPWIAAKVESREYCLTIEQNLGGSFFMPTFLNEDTMNYMRLMKEGIYSSLTIFALRKGSPLKYHLNMMLGRARESGLFFYWEDLTVRNYLSFRSQVSVLQSRIQIDDGPTNLQVHHIVGSFYLLGFGLIVGTIVFLFELLIQRISLVKERMDKEKTKVPEGKITVIKYPPFKQHIRLIR